MVMTNRDRLLAAIRGEPTDSLPWAPRMDLWLIALRERHALSDRFAQANTTDIADELHVACHAVRADYTLPRPPEALLLRGLGVDNHPDYPYRVELDGLPYDFQYKDDQFRTAIRTNAGDVFLHLQHTREMAREGISLPFVKSYAIRSPDDLEAIGQIFDHLKVIPTPEAYAGFRKRIGEPGLAVASGMIAASPMHLILHDLVAMDQFFYLYADVREALYRLCARMEPFFEAVLDALVECEAEVVLWGANYDQNLTWPPFFKDEIVPWLQRASARVHAAGMGSKVTVWGGIPAVCLLDSSMNNEAFEHHLDELFESLGSGERLILGVSDNVPPDADLTRLERIKERVKAFGPICPTG